MWPLKRLLAILLVLSSITLLALSAFAHPGSTDNDGGHFDRTTGEYHYHHGYPAHSHYDKNGDGIVDCPYNFDDQTNHDGGNDNKTKDSHNTNKNGQKKKIDWGSLALTLIAMTLYVICFLVPMLAAIVDKFFSKNKDDK